MALEGPAWLNADHLQKILRNAEQDESILVTGVTVKPATVAGDNYSSVLHRAIVKLSRVIQDGRRIDEEKSLIVKAAFQDDPREEMMEEIGFFKTELSMWSVTLPKMNEILADLGSAALSAQCFYVQHEKPTHGVVEDLTCKNFRMVERQAGLDLDHSLLALRNLGRFHAASIALKQKEEESVTVYRNGLLNMDHVGTMGKHMNMCAQQLSKVTAKWPELNPRITEKLENLGKNLYETACKAAAYQEDDFNVLNHGDFWINNMMFRYDENLKPIDFVFLDFQFSKYGSPALDIWYFLGTSPTNDVRLNHHELLLREYHTSLTNTMEKLNCVTEAPSFEKLQDILKQRAFCQVFAAVTILPVVVLAKGEEIDIKEILEKQEEYENPAYSGKSYREIMTKLLPLFDSMGLLDI